MSKDIIKDRILVIDFGSQYTQLIARRVREIGVYCEIYHYKSSLSAIKKFNPQGIILSGGPETVEQKGSPKVPDKLFDLEIPVLVLSQLSRKVEDQERKPRLSDLRDSGSIEQDADLVALLHKTEGGNIVEVIVAKHRNGPCGAVDLEFVPHLTRFKPPSLVIDE